MSKFMSAPSAPEPPPPPPPPAPMPEPDDAAAKAARKKAAADAINRSGRLSTILTDSGSGETLG